MELLTKAGLSHLWAKIKDRFLPLTGGTLSGSLTAPAFVKAEGTSSQFLKADGCVDSNSYALESAVPFPLLFDHNKQTPVKTIEYDLKKASYFPIFTRNNSGVSVEDFPDVVSFRVTVTGENIFHRIDFVCFIHQYTSSYYPNLFALNHSENYSSALLGFYGARFVCPKAINNGYSWAVEAYAYNSNARHVKVEVFKSSDDVTWRTSADSALYNATYHVASAVSMAVSGFRVSGTLYITANQAISAAYLNSYLPVHISAHLLVAGAALANNKICFQSASDGRVYPISSTEVPINPDTCLMVCGTTYSAGATISYAHLRSIGLLTVSANVGLTYPTLTAGMTLYLRCTLRDGNIYSDNVLTSEPSAGYTWVVIGRAKSATEIAYHTEGQFFFTLDSNGKLTHINVKAIPLPPSTLDDLPDGKTRSLSNYVKKVSDGSLIFEERNPDVGSGNFMKLDNLHMTFGYAEDGYGVTLDGDGLLAGRLDVTTDDADVSFGTEWTKYSNRAIIIKESGETYALTLPKANGTIALTSQIPTVPTAEDLIDQTQGLRLQNGKIGLKLGYGLKLVTKSDAGLGVDPLHAQDQEIGELMLNIADPAVTKYEDADMSNQEQESDYPYAISFLDATTTRHGMMSAADKLALAGKEDSSNKVTSISSSSTHAQYPSAKCVYDLIGDIETLINAL